MASHAPVIVSVSLTGVSLPTFRGIPQAITTVNGHLPMYLSLIRFYWLRLLGAVLALVFALLYLFDYHYVAMAGFGLVAGITIYITIRINGGTMPARCDLCGTRATMGAEYGAGYANARLILNCNSCGRVINGAPGSVRPERERSN